MQQRGEKNASCIEPKGWPHICEATPAPQAGMCGPFDLSQLASFSLCNTKKPLLWKHPGFPEDGDRVLEILDGVLPPALRSSEFAPMDKKPPYERMPG